MEIRIITAVNEHEIEDMLGYWDARDAKREALDELGVPVLKQGRDGRYYILRWWGTWYEFYPLPEPGSPA